MPARPPLNPARHRLAQAKLIRRNAAQALSRTSGKHALSLNFSVGLDHYSVDQFPGTAHEKVKAAVAQLLTGAGVTAENMEKQEAACQLWDTLNPMYDTLRMIISETKRGVSKPERISKFWLEVVVPELDSQLNEILTAAGVRSMNTKYVIEDELKKR